MTTNQTSVEFCFIFVDRGEAWPLALGMMMGRNRGMMLGRDQEGRNSILSTVKDRWNGLTGMLTLQVLTFVGPISTGRCPALHGARIVSDSSGRKLGAYGLFSAASATQFKRELHDPANVIR
jgi:hypothetical protein